MCGQQTIKKGALRAPFAVFRHDVGFFLYACRIFEVVKFTISNSHN